MSGSESGRTWNVRPLFLDTVVYPDWHPRYGEVGPVYVYVVENDEDLILVDTGIGPEKALLDRLYQPTRRDLATALAEDAGIGIDDIDAVVISHLHFDHVGGAQAFRGTPIYVQRTEWEAAQAPKYTVPEFLDWPGQNFVLLDGDVELRTGLRLLVTGGHTPGHQVVAVETEAGTVVLAGQIVETKAEMDAFVATGELKDWNGDGSQNERLAGAKRVLERRPSRVWFSHDHEVWERPAR